MAGSGSSTRRAELPVAAHPVAQGTHCDVVLWVADFHTGERERGGGNKNDNHNYVVQIYTNCTMKMHKLLWCGCVQWFCLHVFTLECCHQLLHIHTERQWRPLRKQGSASGCRDPTRQSRGQSSRQSTFWRAQKMFQFETSVRLRCWGQMTPPFYSQNLFFFFFLIFDGNLSWEIFGNIPKEINALKKENCHKMTFNFFCIIQNVYKCCLSRLIMQFH